MKPFLVDIPHINYYSLFYLTAFFIGFIILLWEGRMRKFPLLPWLIVIGAGFIFFVFGCRIFTISGNDWKTILANQPLNHPTGMVMLGGLLFSVPAIFAAKRLVHLGDSVLDAYAFVLPTGMFLQRIGCFLSGCCYGTVTSGWGIQYAYGTSVFNQHFTEGILPPAAGHSLPVHPVQLYESIGCLLAVVILWKLKSKFKSPGSLFYFSGLSYYGVRFITEFFRADSAHAGEVFSWGRLNTIQWVMIALIIGSVIIIAKKEQTPTCVAEKQIPRITFRYVLYLLGLSSIFFFASKWLRPNEILVVYMVLFSTGAYLAVELFKNVTAPKFRLASLCLIFLSLVLMSQTYPELKMTDSTRVSYNTLSIGALLGSQTFSVDPVVATDCDGNSTSIPGRKYDYKYQLGAIGFSRTIQNKDNSSFTFGLNAYGGKVDEQVTGGFTSDRPALNSYGFNPFLQVDYRLFAFGGGVHLGDMTFIPDNPETTGIKRYSAYPQLYMRIGHLKYVFGELNYAKNFPSSFPATVFQTSLGFGFNRNRANSGVIRVGTSTATGIFFSSSIPIGRNFILEPYIGVAESFMAKNIYSADYGGNDGFVGSMNLHYKFNRKQRSN